MLHNAGASRNATTLARAQSLSKPRPLAQKDEATMLYDTVGSRDVTTWAFPPPCPAQALNHLDQSGDTTMLCDAVVSRDATAMEPPQATTLYDAVGSRYVTTGATSATIPTPPVTPELPRKGMVFKRSTNISKGAAGDLPKARDYFSGPTAPISHALAWC